MKNNKSLDAGTTSRNVNNSAPSSTLPTIGVIGAGLIGGSVAIAAAQKHYPVLVTDKDESMRRAAVTTYCLGWAENNEVIAREADIVIIAAPADAVPHIVADIAPHMRSGQVLLDVASTKVSPTMSLTAAPQGVKVIGSHPMAGKTPGGFENAESGLFQGCTWVLCPPDGQTIPQEVTRLVADLGAGQTLVCSPQEHDRAVASISHSVQVSATSLAAAVNSVVSHDKLPWLLAAGGWRDSTRIAESDPSMWVPVLLENSDNVIPVITELVDRLTAMKDSLQAGDSTKVSQLIEDGSSARMRWQQMKPKLV